MSFDPVEADRNDPLSWTRDEFELPLRAESGGKGKSSLSSHYLFFLFSIDNGGSLEWLDIAYENPSNGSLTLYCPAHIGEGELVYLCGNSLGLLPKRGRQIINEELDVWSRR